MRTLVTLMILVLVSGCASQMHIVKDSVSVPGAGVITAVSIESQNGLSNNLKVIQTYQAGVKTGEYAHGNDGIMYPLLSGAINAGGQIGAAAVMPSDHYETNNAQVGGGADVGVGVDVSATGGNAVSSSTSVARQNQSLNNQNTNFNTNHNTNFNANSNSNSNRNNGQQDRHCR